MEREFQVGTRELAPALDALEAALRGGGVPEETLLELRLVAEEVLSNVARYGHDDGAPHQARVRLTLLAGEVTLEFSDDGQPFDPLSAPPPDLDAPLEERPIGGLGIHLLRSLVDELQYARVGSRNVLTVTKRVAGPSGEVA